MEHRNLSFRLKLIKKEDLPGVGGTPIKINLGVYEKVKQGNIVKYDRNKFSLQEMKDAIGALYTQPQPKQRSVKLVTNQAGLDLFNEALKKEFLKQSKKDEYRKKFRFRSKILKQTYKFG
jgi:hypothetical protein